MTETTRCGNPAWAVEVTAPGYIRAWTVWTRERIGQECRDPDDRTNIPEADWRETEAEKQWTLYYLAEGRIDDAALFHLHAHLADVDPWASGGDRMTSFFSFADSAAEWEKLSEAPKRFPSVRDEYDAKVAEALAKRAADRAAASPQM